MCYHTCSTRDVVNIISAHTKFLVHGLVSCYVYTDPLEELWGMQSVVVQPPPREAVDVSGVEMESPHKSAVKEKEVAVTIPGIGEVSTMWVGLRGKQQVRRILHEELERKETHEARIEIKHLASECKKAFDTLEAEKSSDPRVQNSIALCSAYLPGSSSKPSACNSKVAQLWKRRHEHSHPESQDTMQVASEVLGTQLVAAALEQHKEPPDVSPKEFVTLLAWCEL